MRAVTGGETPHQSKWIISVIGAAGFASFSKPTGCRPGRRRPLPAKSVNGSCSKAWALLQTIRSSRFKLDPPEPSNLKRTDDRLQRLK